ncbi:hypothetical protein FOZ61_005656 [Perkinsus olseni]|uniref:Uncharacterized protein n=1 Tax=Perkinsus olseni TaxID=32597 RepID=A0A7J6LGL3_PEROL|nr:hypothetical protein FOZ61_005656 [Perkinsus olseni]
MPEKGPSSSKRVAGGKRPGCLRSTYQSCASCCTNTLQSIRNFCCPTYKLYEDEEGPVTPVRVGVPVLQPVPQTTITAAVQPQVIGKASDPEDKRAKAAAAAEQRQEEHRTRGLGDSARGSSLEEAARKDELMGRIVELYTANREDPPLGLRLMTVKQLREHYQALKERNDTNH